MLRKVNEWMDRKVVAVKGSLCKKSDAMGTVEVILIICCLVGIVIIFKAQITDLVESIFSKITSQAGRV